MHCQIAYRINIVSKPCMDSLIVYEKYNIVINTRKNAFIIYTVFVPNFIKYPIYSPEWYKGAKKLYTTFFYS